MHACMYVRIACRGDACMHVYMYSFYLSNGFMSLKGRCRKKHSVVSLCVPACLRHGSDVCACVVA
jgi:hypothetical protein